MREFIHKNEDDQLKRSQCSQSEENVYNIDEGLKMSDGEPAIKMKSNDDGIRMTEGKQSINKYTDAPEIQMEEDDPKVTMGHTLKHKVESDDTLWDISMRYNVSLDALREANPQTQTRKQKDQVNADEYLKIPGQNTLKSINLGKEKIKLTTQEYGPIEGRGERWGYGFMNKIIMKYESSQDPDIKAEYIDYVQTVHTNIDRAVWNEVMNPEEESKVGLKDTYFIDPLTVSNLDEAKFFGGKGDLVTPLPSFADTPFITSHPDSTIFFRAETSMVIKEPGNFRRVLTFTWGYSATPNGLTTLEPIKYLSATSDYHNEALTKLKVKI